MMKRITLIFLLIINYTARSQNITANWFVRNAHIANYNLTNQSVYYTPAMASGFGFSHKRKFIELATFVNKQDDYGLFTFFGSNIHKTSLDENWKLYTNWFGEFTLLPKQKESKSIWIGTSGICFFINHEYKWGAIGIPLCIGGVYSQQTFSLNSRAILNLSINIK
jgi:hypothetical protein